MVGGISSRGLVSGVTVKKLEARGGIEPPIKVLQTFALPLGDRALLTCARLPGAEQLPHDRSLPAQAND